MAEAFAAAITGLILAGGRGSRMGGVDKGLQPLHGRPLVAHVLERLQPQVGTVLINANRNAEAYAAFGCAVIADADAGFAGPLAGLLAGLRQAETEWLLSVPCDSPNLPCDLAARLFARLADDVADIAVPVTGLGPKRQIQPVFCLLRRGLSSALSHHLSTGGRKVESWLLAQKHCLVPFERPGDEQAFFNANTLAELQGLQASERHHA